jgi:HSP20 family protein
LGAHLRAPTKEQEQDMSTMQRWTPARDFARLQDEVTRLFDGSLGLTRSTESYGWTPAVDVFEDTEGVTFKFDLPEIDAKDVDVGLEDGVLTVRGQRKLEREDKRESYHRIERSYGVFARSFTLPATLQADKATAEQKNGVLRVFVPKRAEAKPKSISVKVN